ncbi:DNA mismatch repair protein MutS [Natrinema thermotolerans]|uniref:DNA mismatch repair protein MutS n=1 Tax=Natrinema thermotolerans TaxID=121872 RepID=A0AAF0PB82_9EURY|nr:DNA mismatch repair protein MutS [Natrinema thermotolerans]QCC60351.1 DNA mismatch repair protein MutS [Natrinema thermotolerans]QCC61259.1 DNA mismatch repair protein MutS [Natrinema thermotolerans]WMT07376.1 DNA mismatch repair protein MutS [Natrinema thermotolerans]WMT08008.1 DNA mismatch repair protein MutS [Natrinema thermotolerans]
MDPALGPPEAMAEKRDELTPMMRQYHDLCARYDDAIVLFQVGDFYETFCGAAERSARLLEVALTSREDSTGEYPMAGIPIDNAESYIEELLEAGYRVAVADQVEEPGESSGVVERAVTRVITPGTLTEDELLAGDDNNFVAAVARGEGAGSDGDEIALALLDVSTGDFLATSSSSREAIADEVSRFDPAEAVVDPDAPADLLPENCMVTPYDETAFDRDRAGAKLSAYFRNPDALLASDAEIRACGALLSYAEYVRGGAHEGERGETADEAETEDDALDDEDHHLEYLTHLTRYDPREYLLLDAVALRSLELFEPRTVHGRDDATLVGVLDETASALGGRKLRDWLRRPLLEPDRIEARLDAVEELTGAVRTRERLHDLLRDVYDLERLIGRISRERANARDLRSLRDTLAVVPEVREELADADCDRLRRLHDALDPLADVRELIDDAIVADPPIEITEGGVVAEGYDADLDDLRGTARDGKQWIDDLEERERERTGIDSLKVGYNSVHGYYIEVTNPNLESVPENYQRRQTLKNSERFVTPELKEREDEIVGAEERADEREYDLFCEVRREVAAEVERVQGLAEALAALDALVSLATAAAQYDYCRPEIEERGSGADGGGRVLEIEGGRHPVVERTQESFVPNDARFTDDRRLAVITGPNMSGKSTYMRQVAQIVLLAQVGSFVPASAARLTPVDRIFTRVGASDDIAGGRSTFMVEMDELATILREADENSLVLLDEVGRGTSTADGMAIAQAITEHLHDRVGATTLFATHHHPLTELADDLAAAFTLHFEVEQVDGEVVFHHEIAPGAATGSYGVEVATAAGVPDSVVDRARDLVAAADADTEPGDEAIDTATASSDAPAAETAAATADGGDVPTDVAAELRALDLAHLTPVEALTELDRLKRLLEE